MNAFEFILEKVVANKISNLQGFPTRISDVGKFMALKHYLDIAPLSRQLQCEFLFYCRDKSISAIRSLATESLTTELQHGTQLLLNTKLLEKAEVYFQTLASYDTLFRVQNQPNTMQYFLFTEQAQSDLEIVTNLLEKPYEILSEITMEPGSGGDPYFNALYYRIRSYIRDAVGSFAMYVKLSRSTMFKLGPDQESTLNLVVKYAKCAQYLVAYLNDDENEVINLKFASSLERLFADRCSDDEMMHNYIAQIFISFLCDWDQPVGLSAITRVIYETKMVYKHLCFVPDAIDSLLKLTRKCGDKEQNTVPSRKFDLEFFYLSQSGFRVAVITALYRKFVMGEFTDDMMNRYRCYFKEYNLCVKI